jgi:AcrR family transcriptional regulator
MARTKEFDPDAALQKAVKVFWSLGYERTSLEMLMREMGISKQSLYDTFGDKRSILRENQREVERIFRMALAKARERGEIGWGKSPAALAKFFIATIQGMRALARLNHDRKELRHIAKVALEALD